jgi:hypothetical protein
VQIIQIQLVKSGAFYEFALVEVRMLGETGVRVGGERAVASARLTGIELTSFARQRACLSAG